MYQQVRGKAGLIGVEEVKRVRNVKMQWQHTAQHGQRFLELKDLKELCLEINFRHGRH